MILVLDALWITNKMTINDLKNLQILNIKKEIKNYLIRDASIFSSRIVNTRRDKILNSFNKSKISFNKNSLPVKISDTQEIITHEHNEDIILKENSLEEEKKEVVIPIKDSTTENTDIKISFSKLKAKVEFCTRCDLSNSRTRSVFGSGTGNIKLVCIGEAPGESEDKQGLPFVGKSGELLTKMLGAINIDREDIFITNVIKCRPPLNRDPKDDEIQKCSIYLDEQLQVLKPKYILALGRVAAKRLLGLDYSMKKFREEIQNYKGIPVIVTYHPSALLRNPNWKRPSWEDLLKLQKLLKD